MYKITNIARSFARYPKYTSKGLSSSKSISVVAARQNMIQQVQWLSTGSRSTSKDQPLYEVIKDGASLHRVQYLIKQGLNPNELDPQLKENALHTAAKMGDATMCALLLYWGGDITHRNIENETPDEVAVEGSEAQTLLYAMKSKLQNNNIGTNAMCHQMMYFVKQSIISTMRSIDNENIQKSLDVSLALEEELLLTDKEGKNERLKNAIQNLEPNQFVWLSSAFQDHAISIVIKKTVEHDIEFVIANRGEWSETFHDQDETGQVYPKVYALKADAADESKELFMNHVSDGVADFYEEYLDAVKPGFETTSLRSGYVFYRGFNLSVIPDVVELVRHGTPGVPQNEDNCVTVSQWAALDYLFSPDNSEVTFSEIHAAYENYLDKEIEKIVPRLTGQLLDQVVETAKGKTANTFLESDKSKLRSSQKQAMPSYEINKAFSQINQHNNQPNNTPSPIKN